MDIEDFHRDAFGVPVVFLQDTPGFLVGTAVEHDRQLARAMLFLEALCLARVPRLTVVLRKAFGLAFFSLGGSGRAAICWCPGRGRRSASWTRSSARASCTVTGWRRSPARNARPSSTASPAQLGGDTDPVVIAAAVNLDEVIDPADTRVVLADALERLAGAATSRPSDLVSWPHWW